MDRSAYRRIIRKSRQTFYINHHHHEYHMSTKKCLPQTEEKVVNLYLQRLRIVAHMN